MTQDLITKIRKASAWDENQAEFHKIADKYLDASLKHLDSGNLTDQIFFACQDSAKHQHAQTQWQRDALKRAISGLNKMKYHVTRNAPNGEIYDEYYEAIREIAALVPGDKDE
jgi:hypothetical protein